MDEEYLRSYYEGLTLQSRRDFEEAIEKFWESVRSQPNPQSLRAIGECQMELGRFQDAVVYLAASIGLMSNPKASFLLASALVECDADLDALKAVQQAIDQLPHYKKAIELRDMILGRCIGLSQEVD